MYEVFKIGIYERVSMKFNSLALAKFEFQKSCKDDEYLVITLFDVENDELIEVAS